MGDLVYLNDYRPCVLMPDGGKARIRDRRARLGLSGVNQTTIIVDELLMDHADPESVQLPCDCG
ncbi:hypothetical protein V1291_000032 [Nitrobacteraceae bacterium AZCC 1564]